MYMCLKIKKMFKKLRDQKNSNKKFKVFGKLSYVLIIMFIASFINIPFTKKDEGTASASVVTENKIDYSSDVNVVKILEVGPDKQSKLLGRTCEYKDMPYSSENNFSSDGILYNVTYIDMPMYISMIDDIEGLYDAVVISDNGGNYTNPQSVIKAQFSGSKTTNNISLVDYKSENDITNKRAKLITDMIDKGQLVYMDDQILNTPLSGTNLYKIFKNKTASNFIKTSSSNITINNVLDDYSTLSTKKPKVKEIYKPQDEIREDRKLNFKVNAMSDTSKIRIKLYLDANGDGIYTEDELMHSEDFASGQDYRDYEFCYMLSRKYIGFLAWKVDVVSLIDEGGGVYSEAAKSSCISNVISKAVTPEDKKNINVLQIEPDSEIKDNKHIAKIYGGSNTINTVLTENDNFNTFVSEVDDYNIKIDTMSVTSFCNDYYNDIKTGELEKKYNMLIIGFCDNYNFKDFDVGAISVIKKYISDGNSVMFTHDTMSHKVNGSTTCANLTRGLRDYVGQSRYGDPYRLISDDNYNNSDIIKTYNPSTGYYDNKNIPHDYTKNYTLGETDLATCWNSLTYSESVKLINKAQITDYPYKLSDTDVPVNVTHTQWFQLNLEDEDVVPWYNIIPRNGEFNQTDSRNFYYTYSKGNITYSGTGHRGVDKCVYSKTDIIPNAELELFINTIVKSYMGANHPPVVDNSVEVQNSSGDTEEVDIPNGTTSQTIAKKGNNYEFYTLPSDGDLDKVTVNITANNIPISNNNILVLDTNKKYDGGLIPSNSKLKVTIPVDIYKNIFIGNTFEVNVKVTDNMEAYSSKNFFVTVGNSPPDITSYSKEAFTDDHIDDQKTMVNLSNQSKLIVNGTEDFDFISIPNDVDNDKMNVYVKTEGLTSSLNEYKTSVFGKESKEKINFTIPKEYFANKEKGSTFKISVTVKDVVNGTEYESYEETFNVLVGNHSPTIENDEQDELNNYVPIDTDTDTDGIKNAKYSVKSSKSEYLFLSKIRDMDYNDDLKLTVYCEDSTGEGFNEVLNTKKKAQDEPSIDVHIPNKYYEKSIANNPDGEDYSKFADKKRGESFKIKTVVEDSDGATSEEIFTAKVSPNNKPYITAFENNGITEIPENELSINKMAFSKSYKFYVKVNDIDTEDALKVSACINNISKNLYVDGESLDAKVFRDGDKFQVEIPYEAMFVKDSMFLVSLKVTDSYGDSSYRTFKVKVTPNNNPTITNFEAGSDDEINYISRNTIKMGEPFVFDILPDDIDGDNLSVTVSADDGKNIYKMPPVLTTPGQKITGVSIPRDYYLNKYKGENFLVNVLAEDGYGGEANKNFYVKIKDDNASSIENYEENGTDLIENGLESKNHPNVNSIFNKNDQGKFILTDNLSGDDFKFVTLPKDNDDDLVNVNVSVKVNGVNYFVKSYKNVEANKKLDVTIPRSFYNDLVRGDSFEVYVSVSDNLGDSLMEKENVCETKTFTVKLKENENPIITNYDTEKNVIDETSNVQALKQQDYKFLTNIGDGDDNIVKLTVKCEGFEVFSDYVLSNEDREILIPRECYSIKNRGDIFNVEVITEDRFNGIDQKTFSVKITDNKPPDVKNFTANEPDTGTLEKISEIADKGSGGTAKTFKDYKFITVPEDEDDEYVDVNIEADGHNIFSKENVKTYEDIDATIPKEIYESKMTGDKIAVKVTVQDKNGGSKQKTFYIDIKANNPPKISNYYSKSNIYPGYDTPSKEASTDKTEINDKETIYEKNEETDSGYEFVTLPYDEDENDKNNLKVAVTATIKGNETVIFDKSNQISGEEIKILIPKDLYKDLGKNENINIKTTVTDSSYETDTKEFDLIINKAPTVINRDLNNNNIEDEAVVNVTRYHDFVFNSICDDIDEEDHLTFEIYLQDEKLAEYTVKPDEFRYNIKVTIPNEKFNKLNENEKMKITTKVTDSKGKSSKKSFSINMTNVAPKITNYSVKDFNNIESEITNENIIPECDTDEDSKKSAIKQNKYQDYRFVSVVEDDNELEDLNISVVSTLESENGDEREIPLMMKSGGKDISESDNIKAGARVTITAPQSLYKEALPGDFVKITTKVTDEFGASRSSFFYIVIDNINPTVNHSILKSEDANGDVILDIDEASKRVRTYDTVKFAGRATDVYCSNKSDAKITLDVDSNIDVKGDVVLYRLINSGGIVKKSREWIMHYNSINKCYEAQISYDLATEIGKVEPEGMTFIVKYNGLIKSKSSKTRKDFVNKLFVNSIEGDANTFTNDIDFNYLEPLF